MKGLSGKFVGVIALLLIFGSLAAAGGIAINIYSNQGAPAEHKTAISFDSDGNAVQQTYSHVVSNSYYNGAEAQPSGLAISINNGSAFSSSMNVTLNLSAEGATECRYKNDDDPDWGVWEAYATTKAWTLSAGGDGERVVAYQCRNGAAFDEAAFAYSSIILDGAAPVATYQVYSENGAINATIGVREALAETVACSVMLDDSETEIEVPVSGYRGSAQYIAVVAPGNHSFSVECSDAAGNIGTTPQMNVSS